MVNIASLLIKKNILISTYVRKQYVSLENVPMLQVSVNNYKVKNSFGYTLILTFPIFITLSLINNKYKLSLVYYY